MGRPDVHPATGCPDGHNRGLSCKIAFAWSLAASRMGSHDWMFVVDDDAYVNTTNLESMLLERGNASKLEAHGVVGCGLEWCNGGFCGGGGYAVSQAALKTIINKSEPMDFRAEFLRVYDQTFGEGSDLAWDDICASCLMKQRGFSLKTLAGLWAWQLNI